MASKLEQLKEIYDSLPRLECKGLCVDDCSKIRLSAVERALIQTATGAVPKFDTVVSKARNCPCLVDGRCSIYDVRPLVCRLYGMVDPAAGHVLCRFGCKPERYLSYDEAQALIARARKLMGR